MSTTLHGLRRLDAFLAEYVEDDHFHERRILAFRGPKTVVVCTPHLHVYEEDWAGYKAVWNRGPRGGLPAPWGVPNKKNKIVLVSPEATLACEAMAAEWRTRYPSPEGGGFRPGPGVAIVDGPADVAGGGPGITGNLLFISSRF